MPHAPYTHEVIELTDGRCYCLSCDEVVPERYLDGRGSSGETDRTGSTLPSAAGTDRMA